MSRSWVMRGWTPYVIAAVGVTAAGVAAYVQAHWCCAAPFFLLAGGILLSHALTRREGRALRAYQDALADLRADPVNPDLHQRVQDAGRAYSRATAGGHSEAAIRADIEDATGRASSDPPRKRRKKK